MRFGKSKGIIKSPLITIQQLNENDFVVCGHANQAIFRINNISVRDE